MSRNLIWQLAKKDLQTKYLGSYLGIFWAFVHPAMMILIYWVVFQVGFKSLPISKFPFILWLMVGLVPWIFLADAISGSSGAIIENSYLVKKVVFRVNILPVIKIISSLFIHVFFIGLIFFMFWLYDYNPVIYHLQTIYYLLATLMLVLGISWIVSALTVFSKDITQFVGMLLQCFFWLTPIFWDFKMVPAEYQIYFKLNPVYYIVEGYRETFISHVWFWEHPYLTIYFWGVTSILLVTGVILFKKLRPHFADVL